MKAVDAGFPSAQDPNRNIKEIDVSVQGAALDYAAACNSSLACRPYFCWSLIMA